MRYRNDQEDKIKRATLTSSLNWSILHQLNDIFRHLLLIGSEQVIVRSQDISDKGHGLDLACFELTISDAMFVQDGCHADESRLIGLCLFLSQRRVGDGIDN